MFVFSHYQPLSTVIITLLLASKILAIILCIVHLLGPQANTDNTIKPRHRGQLHVKPTHSQHLPGCCEHNIMYGPLTFYHNILVMYKWILLHDYSNERLITCINSFDV